MRPGVAGEARGGLVAVLHDERAGSRLQQGGRVRHAEHLQLVLARQHHVRTGQQRTDDLAPAVRRAELVADVRIEREHRACRPRQFGQSPCRPVRGLRQHRGDPGDVDQPRPSNMPGSRCSGDSRDAAEPARRYCTSIARAGWLSRMRTPVGASGSVTAYPVSTPWARSWASTDRPAGSSPTRPSQRTECPSRARPAATLLSAPATERRKESACSSGTPGSASMRSIASPHTTTSALIGPVPVSGARTPRRSGRSCRAPPRPAGNPAPGSARRRTSHGVRRSPSPRR